MGQHLILNTIPNCFIVGTGWKVWCDWGMRGWSHRPVWHHPLTSPVVTMWKVMGQHPFLNTVPNNFTTTGTKQKVWCDPGMRGWSHRSVLTPFVGIFSCNDVKSDGPTSISQHNPQQFHSRNRTEILVWSWHEGPIAPASLNTIHWHLWL